MHGYPNYRVNVNLSVVQLLQTDIVEIVQNARVRMSSFFIVVAVYVFIKGEKAVNESIMFTAFYVCRS